MRSLLGPFFLLLGCGVIAACSASGGGGTSALPGGLPPLSNPVTTAPSPTATPNFVTTTVLVGGDSTPQTLNAPGDFRVTAVFPASSASPIPVKVTVSVAGPPDIMAYAQESRSKKGLFAHRQGLTPAVLYIWFENDKGAVIATPPALTISVPLPVLDPYGTNPDVNLALYDPSSESKWMLSVAQPVAATPTPSGGPSASTSGSPAATATASATPTASGSPSPRPSGASPTATATATGTAKPIVPAVQFGFSAPERPMKLVPRKNFVMVLYAVPAAVPSPSPSGSAAAESSSRRSPGPSASGESASPAASASGSGSAAPQTDAPSGKPSASGSPQPKGT